MKDATIDDVTGLLSYIEGHVQHARDELEKRDRAGVLRQIDEILGWANAAAEALADPGGDLGRPKTDAELLADAASQNVEGITAASQDFDDYVDGPHDAALLNQQPTPASDFAGIENAGGGHVDFDNDDRFDDPAGDHDG